MNHRPLILAALVVLALTGTGCGNRASPKTGDPKKDGNTQPINGTGCTCDQVTVTVVKEPDPPKPPADGKPGSPGIAYPPTGSADAGKAIGGAYAPDGAGGGKPHEFQVKVDGPKDDCCSKITVGLMQTLVKGDSHAEYSGGGKITGTFIDPKTGKEIKPPLCDSDPPDAPGSSYPYYDATSEAKPAKCGDTVTFTFSDAPNPGLGGYPPVKGGQKLTKVVFDNSFRVFLVWECPTGTYNILRHYDWSQKFEVTIDYSTTPPSVKLDTAGDETGRGGAPTDDPKQPTTTGPVPNTAGNQPGSQVPTGF